MLKAICLLAVVPMRKEPSHRSEMVSQLLFGEYITVGEGKEDFVHVTCLYDGYEGWVQANQLERVESVLETTSYTNGFASLVTVNNTSVQVPYGAPVFNPQSLSTNVADNQISYLVQPQQIWHSQNMTVNETALTAAYQPFLNTPYLWGGKSVFGIDCSGFAQQVFKLFGVKLLRDAYLQAEQGTAVASVEETKPGDLAFFQNEKGRITHVGIVLRDKKIVHASGRVRIDAIDAEGINNLTTGKRSHHLHSIRRYF